MSLTLFPDVDDEARERLETAAREMNARAVGAVPGLRYAPEFLSIDEERDLLARLDACEWSGELARRVQHYGYRYEYRARRVDPDMRLGDLPPWLAELGARLHATGLLPHLPDQAIVNEYEPGQGIAAHVDCEPCFADGIASLSLGAGCIMEFTRPAEKGAIPVYLAPRSVVVLEGEARYAWRHGIARRQKDIIGGQTVPRARRVSLTFRKVAGPESASPVSPSGIRTPQSEIP